jgi:hypothetical protein
MIKKLLNVIRLTYKWDKDGNIIFQIFNRIEFLCFPELNYISLIIGCIYVKSQNNKITVQFYDNNTKEYTKITEINR